MKPIGILIIIILTTIFILFIYTIISFIVEHTDNDQETPLDYLTPQEKQQAIDQFRNNYGWTSPEAQQKIMRAKYVSPAALQRDLEFYNQDEYIGKFEGRK